MDKPNGALREALTFDDVLLKPGLSELLPSDADIRSRITREIPLNLPIIASAMDTVCEGKMAIALAQAGGLGVIHRNLEPDEQAAQVRQVKKFEAGMVVNPVTIAPTATLADALELMKAYSISGIRQRVVGRGDDHELVVGEPLPFEGRIVGRASRDGDVGLVGAEAAEDGLAVADVQAHVQLGVVLAKGPDQRRQQVLADGGDRGDPQVAAGAAGDLARDLRTLPEQAEDVGRVARIGLAGRGRPHVAADPLGSFTPSSRSSAATAAETEGWVTTSSSAAAVTDPWRTTDRTPPAGSPLRPRGRQHIDR